MTKIVEICYTTSRRVICVESKTNNDENKNRHSNKLLIFISVVLISLIGTFMLITEQKEMSNISENNVHTETFSGAEYFASAHGTDEAQIAEKPSTENKININTATKTELMFLTGIGEKKAENIIAYRQESPFQSIEELMQVDGIGEKTFEENKDYICIE